MSTTPDGEDDDHVDLGDIAITIGLLFLLVVWLAG
jgi:hypothetical protein